MLSAGTVSTGPVEVQSLTSMTSKDQYSSEFKAEVAREALDQNKQNLDRLSDKYDVPVSLILRWAVRLERNPDYEFESTPVSEPSGAEAEDDTVVDVDIGDEKVSRSISYGVMPDDLDIKKLTFWSVLGIVFVIIFVQLLKEMYDQTTQINREMISAQSEFYDVTEQNRQAREKLNSFGVVDISEGIYRIPIDSAINEIAVDVE